MNKQDIIKKIQAAELDATTLTELSKGLYEARMKVNEMECLLKGDLAFQLGLSDAWMTLYAIGEAVGVKQGSSGAKDPL